MSDDTSIAVESPPPQQRRKEQPADARPKQQPPYAVVLFNDEEHTFQYVIETLMKVFGYPLEKSYALTPANPQRRQGHRLVGHAGIGRTQTGPDSFGRPGFLRHEEGGLPPKGDHRAAAGLTRSLPPPQTQRKEGGKAPAWSHLFQK